MGTRGRLEARITVPTGGWTGTIDDSGAGAAATFAVPAGTYYLSSPDIAGGGTKSLMAAFRDALNAAATTDTIGVTASVSESGTGKVTITSSGTAAIVWTSTDLRDLLGFTTNLAAGTTWTGSCQARSLWLPDCPYDAPNELDGTWWGEPEADMRGSRNAAGYVWSHKGSSCVVLDGLSWEAVSRHKAILANEITVNESWERFVRDGIWGDAAWGTTGGPVRLYPDAELSAAYGTYAIAELGEVKLGHFSPGYVAGSRKIPMPVLVQVPGTETEGLWRLPATAAEWVATFPAIATPTNLWPLQESGSTFGDAIGGKDLTGTATTAQVTGDPLSRYAVEFQNATSARLRPASTADLDLTTNNFTLFFRFKVAAAESPASGHHLARKRSSSAGTDGWALKFAGSGGNLVLAFDSPAAAQTTGTAALSVDDGQWHFAMVVIDRTGGNMYIYTDLETTITSISAHAGGSLTNATFFGFGDTNGNLNASAIIDYSYAAAWVGTALTAADFATISGTA